MFVESKWNLGNFWIQSLILVVMFACKVLGNFVEFSESKFDLGNVCTIFEILFMNLEFSAHIFDQ